jgi:hypothetical protein
MLRTCGQLMSVADCSHIHGALDALAFPFQSLVTLEQQFVPKFGQLVPFRFPVPQFVPLQYG